MTLEDAVMLKEGTHFYGMQYKILTHFVNGSGGIIRSK